MGEERKHIFSQPIKELTTLRTLQYLKKDKTADMHDTLAKPIRAIAKPTNTKLDR